MGKMINNQSEEAKAIKRVNERIAALNRLQSTDNPFIAPYSRAIHELGLEFTKEPGTNRYKIANTAENRKKAAALESRLKALKAKTTGDIRKQSKKELKTEAEAIGKKRAEQAEAKALEAGKTKKQAKREAERARKAAVKEHTSAERVNQRIEEKVLDIEIQDKLDLIYQYMGEAGKEMGQRLSELAKGKSKSEQDKAEIYDLFGRISDAYRQIQRGEIEQADEQRNSDLNAFYRHFKED